MFFGIDNTIFGTTESDESEESDESDEEDELFLSLWQLNHKLLEEQAEEDALVFKWNMNRCEMRRHLFNVMLDEKAEDEATAIRQLERPEVRRQLFKELNPPNSEVPIVFVAVQCFFCSTMQVKQYKSRSNKWNCDFCDEKQSVSKVFFEGTLDKDVEKFVQDFNISRNSIGKDALISSFGKANDDPSKINNSSQRKRRRVSESGGHCEGEQQQGKGKKKACSHNIVHSDIAENNAPKQNIAENK